MDRWCSHQPRDYCTRVPWAPHDGAAGPAPAGDARRPAGLVPSRRHGDPREAPGREWPGTAEGRLTLPSRDSGRSKIAVHANAGAELRRNFTIDDEAELLVETERPRIGRDLEP